MPSMRSLIINADDFGQTSGINRGVIQAHRRGIVTSASLMVRWPSSPEAAMLAVDNPALSVGLHIDLGEWELREGQWEPRYHVVEADDATAVAREMANQLAEFHRLLGRAPTHLDSHQHVHMRSPVREVAAEAAAKIGVPLRHCGAVRYCGDFYGQTESGQPTPDVISPDGLLRILEALPEGCTELACHPATARDIDTMYSSERLVELETLCDSRVRSAIRNLEIELVSFTRW